MYGPQTLFIGGAGRAKLRTTAFTALAPSSARPFLLPTRGAASSLFSSLRGLVSRMHFTHCFVVVIFFFVGEGLGEFFERFS